MSPHSAHPPCCGDVNSVPRQTRAVRTTSLRDGPDTATDPSAYAFTHPIRVRFAETDAMGIVHHSRYLPYLEEARVAYLRHLEHPYTSLREEGIDMAVLEAYVRYRSPLRFDEVVDVHLGVASATRTTFRMEYLLTVEGDVRATAATVHGCVTPAGRPTRMPAWLRALTRPE
jgi:acyl-CoA thioester hydrolase